MPDTPFYIIYIVLLIIVKNFFIFLFHRKTQKSREYINPTYDNIYNKKIVTVVGVD